MSIIIFDVETNGLPDTRGLPYGKYPPYTDLQKYSGARIVQLSYMVCDDAYQQLSLVDRVVDSKGEFAIANTRFHGITDEMSTSSGTAFEDVAREFHTVLTGAEVLLTHNADFDVNVLRSELHRHGLADVLAEMNRKRVVCTMKSSKDWVDARNTFGKRKDPKLSELFLRAVGEEMQHAHDAKHDVINLHAAVKRLHSEGVL